MPTLLQGEDCSVAASETTMAKSANVNKAIVTNRHEISKAPWQVSHTLMFDKLSPTSITDYPGCVLDVPLSRISLLEPQAFKNLIFAPWPDPGPRAFQHYLLNQK